MDSLSIPGLVVAHTHLYSSLARGMPPPTARPENFPQILERIWWRLDRSLDLETIQMSARVGIAEAVRAGATCLIDHHESPHAIWGSLDVIADEMQRAGVRGVVCYGITARNRGEEEWQAGLAENERFLKTNRRPLVRGMVGIHACFTVPDEAIGEAAAMARAFNVGLHVHVAEDTVDRDAFTRLSRKRALVPKSIYAHGVHLQADEVRKLAESGGWLVQNARSNMANGVGYARLASAGDHVALGTDGWDGDVLAEARALYMRASEAGDPVDVMARIRSGRRLAETLFGGPLPDRVEMEYDPPTPMADENETAHLLFGMPRVVQVVVDGVAIQPYYDPEEARKQAARLWLRMGEI